MRPAPVGHRVHPFCLPPRHWQGRISLNFVLGRRETPPAVPSSPEPASDSPAGTGKGRPTPSRRDAEKTRKERTRVPADQREAAKWNRKRRREAREVNRLAMLSGDEKAFPERDRGPVRKYVRDTVDARRSPGEYFLYLAFVVLGLTFVASPASQALGLFAMLVSSILIVVDSVFLVRRLRHDLHKRFPGVDTSGSVSYGVMRSIQVRRLRLPPPQVSPVSRRKARKARKKTAGKN